MFLCHFFCKGKKGKRDNKIGEPLESRTLPLFFFLPTPTTPLSSSLTLPLRVCNEVWKFVRHSEFLIAEG